MRAHKLSVIRASLHDPDCRPATNLEQPRRPDDVAPGWCDVIGREVHSQRVFASLHHRHYRDPDGNVGNDDRTRAVKDATQSLQ